MLACLQFLSVPGDQLDVGYSRALQREALLCGSEADAVSYLMSSAVQDELAGIFKFGQSTSLDAERKIAQGKKNEKARLSTLARASRNSILTRFRTRREEAVRALWLSSWGEANTHECSSFGLATETWFVLFHSERERQMLQSYQGG